MISLNFFSFYFQVILGGGRSNFLYHSQIDEEDNSGRRHDGKNLIEEWIISKNRSQYVSNKEGLLNIDLESTDYLLGLFEGDRMKYNLDLTKDDNNPSLTEMTRVAIQMLQKNKNGFFLLVENGLIDEAHHNNFAQIALDETNELSKAVEVARNLTSLEDTLIVVTADHAQTIIYNGYPVSKKFEFKF